MREYGVVSPLFWIGETGRALRKNPNAQRVAIYLMTAPSSEMTGVFYCPLSSILNDVGVFEAPLKPLTSPSEGALEGVYSPLEGVRQAILTLMKLDFCFYDFESEFVFVKEMARWQIGESLKEKDNRVVGLRKYVKSMPKPIAARFIERYNEDFKLGFDLEDYVECHKGKPSPSQTSSKPLARGYIEPLRSQEQDQEQDISTNVDKKEKYKKEKKSSKSKIVLDKPDDVSSEQIWSDFLALRNARHAPLTETALNIIRKEAQKAGISLEQALETCCMRGWQGFKAEWYLKGQNRFQSIGPRDFEPEFRPEDYEGGLISDLMQR